MAAKKRKKGDWVNVAKGRDNAGQRILLNGRGLSGYPVNQAGSARYRRLAKKTR